MYMRRESKEVGKYVSMEVGIEANGEDPGKSSSDDIRAHTDLLPPLKGLPTTLYIRGQPPPAFSPLNRAAHTTFDRPAKICIVGSRRHSDYGAQTCRHIIAELAMYDVWIISGLAFGIDSIAHDAALSACLPTAAVLGAGLDPEVLYPSAHRTLADDIVAAGGCIISQFEHSLRAAPWTFPVRNRTMAALADLVIIIEAEEKSGTLITARAALEANIEVGVVPGSIFSPQSDGPLHLLNDGAHIIRGRDDIERALGMHLRPRFGDRLTDMSKNIDGTNAAGTSPQKDIDTLFAKLVKSM